MVALLVDLYELGINEVNDALEHQIKVCADEY